MSEKTVLKGGYTGKIARVNLTNKTMTFVDTKNYAPEYIGGRAIANKIFWDEVKPGTGAFDPENKLILMTGPTCSTGLPTGDRTAMTGIGPNSVPEQYSWGSIGGYLPTAVKYAGYDGIIIEGKAKEPTIVLIDDGSIRFESAEGIWGMMVHETQRAIWERFGDYQSLVIGPAGESLVRIATLTNCNDNAFAKGGFGAVFGSKNLKAICIRGTGKVTPGNIEALLKLRKTVGSPMKKLNPFFEEFESFNPVFNKFFQIPNGRWHVQVACCKGCNARCVPLFVDVKHPFPDVADKITLMNKCVDSCYMINDCGWPPRMNVHTKASFLPECCGWSGYIPEGEPAPDPDYDPLLDEFHPGSLMNLYDFDPDRVMTVAGLCTELGIDRWDVSVWLMSWLGMGYKTGVLTEEDFDGLQLDPISEEVVRKVLTDMVNRTGKFGKAFHEGFWRGVEMLDDKYSKTEYKYQSVWNEKIEQHIPISLTNSWGQCFHWQGRGFQGSVQRPHWLFATLKMMVNTRDATTNGHMHVDVSTWKHALSLGDEIYRDNTVPEMTFLSDRDAEYKESVASCERLGPHLYWTSMETELFNAATGFNLTEDELQTAAVRSLLLYRAIEIRNHQRTRQMEVEMAYRPLIYPDSDGVTSTWEDFNDLVDRYYDYVGYDRETGWPTRETYEKYDLGYVADEMEALGKLPK